MKRVFAFVSIALLLCSCNRAIFDTTWEFVKAIIRMPDNSVLTVKIKRWCDYDDGDQIQIQAMDGTTYLVHSVNVTLIKEK